MSGEADKTGPLFGFAAGIEGAQLLVLLLVLSVTFGVLELVKVNRKYYIWAVSLLIAAISLKLIFF